MLNTTNNTSLKDYYVRLEKMYEQAVNMLTAMSQSLTTAASEITVNVADTDDTETTIRIPSFLYLENKLEELDSNFSTLFNMPESGEAWFEKTSNMYKLKLVKSNSAPITPAFTGTPYASITDNNFLKDLVTPKTYLKLTLDSFPSHIEKMVMKKIVIYNPDVFTTLNNNQANYSTYEEYSAALYTFTKGEDYDEYDSILDMPLKADKYRGSFGILSLKENDSSLEYDIKTWSQQGENGHQHNFYKIHLVNNNLDTYTDENGNTHYSISQTTGLTYFNQEDTSESYELQVGDKLTLVNSNVIYNISSISYSLDEVILEEIVGHMALQTTAENTAMEFTLYDPDYSEFNYIKVPLEENQYIACFFASVYNNIRSKWSNVYLLNMDSIAMYDEYGNPINDNTGVQMSYMQYYKKYCTNIGDLLLGIVKTCEPQVTGYTPEELSNLQESDSLKNYVTDTFDNISIFQVIQINGHLTDDTTSSNLTNLHAQKTEINAQLESINTNINDTYNTLISTDFSQEVSITQQSVKSQLTDYYNQRTELQKQKAALVSQINTAASNLSNNAKSAKYRIRGISEIEDLEDVLDTMTALGNVHIIQLQVQYKYNTTNKETNNLTEINGNTFTDWNLVSGIERHRSLSFNSDASGYVVTYDSYDPTSNIVKWNQVDIPIQQGEDVTLQIRYKYNIGQPFIDLYTPWSDEVVFTFPAELQESVEISDILSQNELDSTTSNFETTLINEGISEHVANKIADTSQTFYHMPENIYSGFNTEDNSLISLKDKLTSMDNDLTTYKSLIDSEVNQSYEVYLEYNGVTTLLSSKAVNKINLFTEENANNAFNAIDMNLIILNTGEVPIKFYSILPGKIDTPLLLTSLYNVSKQVKYYERVPIIEANEHAYQTLGQWIYFRQNNVYTSNDVYNNNNIQNELDSSAIEKINSSIDTYNLEPSIILNYMLDIHNAMASNYKSVLYGYRRREEKITVSSSLTWRSLDIDHTDLFTNIKSVSELETLESIYNKFSVINKIKPFEYVDFTDLTKTSSVLNNNWIMRFEDIYGKSSSNMPIALDADTSITDFISTYNPINFNTEINYIGAFLYPNISSHADIVTDGTDQGFMKLNTGKNTVIPIRFEYYLNPGESDDILKITKALYFDLKDSLISEIDNYMLEITINYNNSSSLNIYNDTVMVDSVQTN